MVNSGLRLVTTKYGPPPKLPPWVALSEPAYGYSIIIEGMMMGTGNTKEPFVYNIIGMWGVRIVGTLICTAFLGGGLVAAWGCMIAHNLLLFALFLRYDLRGRLTAML